MYVCNDVLKTQEQLKRKKKILRTVGIFAFKNKKIKI